VGLLKLKEFVGGFRGTLAVGRRFPTEDVRVRRVDYRCVGNNLDGFLREGG
jgi:hypothetical protein